MATYVSPRRRIQTRDLRIRAGRYAQRIQLGASLLGKDETSYAIFKLLHGRIFLVATGGYLAGYNDKALNSLEGIAKKQNIKLILRERNCGSGMFTELLIGAVQ